MNKIGDFLVVLIYVRFRRYFETPFSHPFHTLSTFFNCAKSPSNDLINKLYFAFSIVHKLFLRGFQCPSNPWTASHPVLHIGSLRNHDGNGDCNTKLLLFQNFRFKRFLPFRSNLLPMRDSEVVLFSFNSFITWKPHF